MFDKIHVVITSPNGPLAAGLADYASLAALEAALNGGQNGQPLVCLSLTDPVTGAVSLVSGMTAGLCLITLAPSG